MNKTKLFLTLFVLSIFSVVAFTMPQPIHGFVTSSGFPLKNLEVKVTNLDTDVSTLAVTNENGFYLVDLANVDTNYRLKDKVKVELVYCKENSKCVKTSALQDGGTKISWDVSVEQLPSIPESVVLVKYVCWDGSYVEDKVACPEQSAPEPPKPEVVVEEKVVIEEKIIEQTTIVCENGDVVGNEADCKGSDWETWLIGLIAGVVGIFVWGKGFASLIRYYLKKAKETKDSVLREKYRKRAEKMAKSVVTNFLAGKYKK